MLEDRIATCEVSPRSNFTPHLAASVAVIGPVSARSNDFAPDLMAPYTYYPRGLRLNAQTN